MKILVIEDEPQAAQRLETLVKSLDPNATFLGNIDSVKKAVEWIADNPPPDLIFMDIQLADGISFQIFELCEVTSPVIFTTAYDEYALRAFKVNSIDYILKPVDREELEVALTKFHALGGTRSRVVLDNIEQAIQMLTKKYKTRFIIKVGEHLRSLEVTDILFFLSLEKATFCYTADGRKNILDFTLDQLEGLLDPSVFFRINRKYIVSVASIQDMVSYANSRLKLVIRNTSDNDIIVARERVQAFKAWLDR
ncbi:MAG: LytTR family DNA-binding domain-containing protein [Cyclobacteriaceae bacterium]|nr:LytTR family DNA-binding domain-containing protein [Cyclobacteriaceae bacterium]MDH4298384.1 LytTR family DNA-binding domain-containing protein [Cyclobacteriaceae bacterium]MDH5250641.1 LytTR family DNA-binding domain-containing protein [Cyclobacteriaceae bacterium]